MRLLTFTTLYPNPGQATHGIFVETRLAHLVGSGRATSQVVAPVVLVPDMVGVPEEYRCLRHVPRFEVRRGIKVHHPRYFLVPKVSMLVAPVSLYLAARRRLSQILAEGYEFDLIDAHYMYPDGVAAAMLGRFFKKPVTITARGSDVNTIARLRWPRKMILWAASEAAGIIAVSSALKASLIGLGIPAEKIRVLRNGVDLEKFNLGNRTLARERLGFDGVTLLSVGYLIPLKGHDLAIKALALLSDARLAIVGYGPEEPKLRALAEQLGVAERVRFLGQLSQDALMDVYRAADVLLLLSSSEGWANVLLEAMACGTGVVATDVGGTSEVLGTSPAGELVRERNSLAVAQAVERLLRRHPDRRAVRAYAEGFSWDATTQGQLDLFNEILLRRATPAAGGRTARKPHRAIDGGLPR